MLGLKGWDRIIVSCLSTLALIYSWHWFSVWIRILFIVGIPILFVDGIRLIRENR